MPKNRKRKCPEQEAQVLENRRTKEGEMPKNIKEMLESRQKKCLNTGNCDAPKQEMEILENRKRK